MEKNFPLSRGGLYPRSQISNSFLSRVAVLKLRGFSHFEKFSETVQYYVSRVPEEHRDKMIDYLTDKKIHTSVHFKPLYLYEPLKQDREYPVCETEWKKLLTLPCHNRMSDEDIDYVVYWVNKYFEENF